MELGVEWVAESEAVAAVKCGTRRRGRFDRIAIDGDGEQSGEEG